MVFIRRPGSFVPSSPKKQRSIRLRSGILLLNLHEEVVALHPNSQAYFNLSKWQIVREYLIIYSMYQLMSNFKYTSLYYTSIGSISNH